MRYLKFVISNYRAITGPLEVDVQRRSLTPIIGINESGKTTILHAIFAFDNANDELNQDGRHLKDTNNLYKTNPPQATVQAEVELNREELLDELGSLAESQEDSKRWVATTKKKHPLPTSILITRNIATKAYLVDTPPLNHPKFGPLLAEEIVKRTPFILFFDDFRDKIDEKIEISTQSDLALTGWLAILERLFKETDRQLSIFQLAVMEERQRKSVLAKVQRQLNSTLTKEWATFRLDDRDALEISIDFVSEKAKDGQERNYIKLDIIETDAHGDAHYFFISDRSKGFFWFFNFVMKLEFNPKVIDDDDNNTIYLLDEPGSYLHASAQSKLCRKLRQLSERNRVIYCTHSHYLLDPEIIPFSSIRVADKDGNGNISLLSIFEHKGNISERRSAFQPVIDALQIKPFILDLTTDRVIITEGICDYYTLTLFRGERPINLIPSVGADSIKFYVSLLLAWQVSFWALWDNDDEGRRCYTEATRIFGNEIADRRFRLLPKPARIKKRILQNLFDGKDITMFKTELGLAPSASFEKVVTALFYSPQKAEILRKVSASTKSNFEELFNHLSLE